jgi:hypothetical protein
MTAAVSVKIYVEMSLDKSAFNTDNGSKRRTDAMLLDTRVRAGGSHSDLMR